MTDPDSTAPGRLVVSDASEQDRLGVLQRSGLFEGGWFAERNPDLVSGSHSSLVHWHRYGWREARWPNPYFDPGYYALHAPDCSDDPLLHYILTGEAVGRRPVPWFDPAWYRANHDLRPDELCLAHYLRHRCTGRVSPIPEFDSAFYLQTNPDVAAAGMDPCEHYMIRGFQEGRAPCPGFDPRRWPGARLDPNPLLGLLRWRQRPRPDPSGTNIADEVRRNTQPHQDFEEVAPLPPGTKPAATVLAFYLPQFHPVPENDAAWGRGFTEWTNLGRALPRFAGHCQPRIPRNLGHYRLDSGDTLRQQAAMARAAGLHGFVFYFYWFNGRRLLSTPLEALLADTTLDLPFCLMWANENWTRRWDGSEHDVLLSQDYRARDEPALVAEFARHFADPRYIRLNGRPILMVYRAPLIPDTAASIARWRVLFRDYSADNPFFVMAQSFGDEDPVRYGMDAAVEFPPHKLTSRVPLINHTLDVLDPAFDAEVYDYEAIALASLAEPAPSYPLIKTAMPGWDNDPRRQGAGTVLHGATPALFQAWLEDLIRHARQHTVGGEALVCINAWNEWAEGASLEPDVHWGGAFLNAASRAIARLPQPGLRTRILLVGHDARRHGSQLLLLRLGRTLRAAHGVEVAFLLLEGGPMEPEYRALAPTTVLADADALDAYVCAARRGGCTGAIVNTAAASPAAPVLARHGLQTVLLVHELPRLLREKHLLEPLRAAVVAGVELVFPADLVRDRVTEALGVTPDHACVVPQGIEPPPPLPGRDALRAALQIPAGTLLALGMGYADARKGFDLFLQVWRALRDSGTPVCVAPVCVAPVCVVWAGGIDPAMQDHLGAEIAAAEATGTFRFLGPRDDPAALMAAADVLLLTSREDPLPSAALEALAAGTPVVAFADTGGIPDLLRQMDAGAEVPLGDAAAMARAARHLCEQFDPARRQALASRAQAAFRMDFYTARLLRHARPDLLPVCAVVLSCDYARYMPARLQSIFRQTYPVSELIVLDDASEDDSLAVAERTAQEWNRTIRVVRRPERSGSVFAQWRRAAELTSADWLWIAEADDEAEPGFLEAVARAARSAPGIVLAFSDSAAIDDAGTTIWPDYKAYYGPDTLAADALFDGGEFLRAHLAKRNVIMNASAVLWRRDALAGALQRCAPDLRRFKVAGDWRVYAEALSQPGARACYVSQPLNRHRRHPASATARLPEAAHADEVRHMQAVVARLTKPPSHKRGTLKAAIDRAGDEGRSPAPPASSAGSPP